MSKKPCYCLGSNTIRRVATESQLETDLVNFVAADDLFHKDPYEQIAQLTKERDELGNQLKELRNHIRCIYCNQKYTAEQAGELADHILTCEKSPLVQMLKEMDSRIIDRMDMVSDEFQRILAITDNQEIIGICERAQQVIEQKEPVIKQRDDAVKERDNLVSRLEATKEVVTWAQCMLTALNVGDCKSESPLHKKLREVMIAYRAKKESVQ